MTLDWAEAERWPREWAQRHRPRRHRRQEAQLALPARHPSDLEQGAHPTPTVAVIRGVTGPPARPSARWPAHQRAGSPVGVLLGRLDVSGRLHYVGCTTPLTAQAGWQLAERLAPATAKGPPWHGHPPSAGRGSAREAGLDLAEPVLVAETSTDTAVDSACGCPVRFMRVRQVESSPRRGPPLAREPRSHLDAAPRPTARHRLGPRRRPAHQRPRHPRRPRRRHRLRPRLRPRRRPPRPTGEPTPTPPPRVRHRGPFPPPAPASPPAARRHLEPGASLFRCWTGHRASPMTPSPTGWRSWPHCQGHHRRAARRPAVVLS